MIVQQLHLNFIKDGEDHYSVTVQQPDGSFKVVPVRVPSGSSLDLIPALASEAVSSLDKAIPDLFTSLKELSSIDLSSIDEKYEKSVLGNPISNPLKAKVEELVGKLQWPAIRNLETYTNKEAIVLLKLLQIKLGE